MVTDTLDMLENRSIYLIREAYAKYRNIAMLWSIGKDSTALLALCRKAFLGWLPFPVMHIDTGYKFKEIYDFRDEYTQRWGLDLRVFRNEEAIAAGMSNDQKFECCNALKTQALKMALAEYGFGALLLGIRRDEHGIRAKERYFSPRNTEFKWDYTNQPMELWDSYGAREQDTTHQRIHPLLHWREIDIWHYIQREKLPVVNLYFANEGKRYRSIGCECCCNPVDSDATDVEAVIEEIRTNRAGERAGRAQDKESATTMQKLRAMGYM